MRAHVRKRRAESEDPRIRKNVYRRVRVCSRVWHRYSRNSYQNAIFKACRRAEVPEWGPNRLRHNAATHLREQFGIEAARVVLGHASAAMTEVYAEIDRSKAADIMAQVG